MRYVIFGGRHFDLIKKENNAAVKTTNSVAIHLEVMPVIYMSHQEATSEAGVIDWSVESLSL